MNNEHQMIIAWFNTSYLKASHDSYPEKQHALANHKQVIAKQGEQNVSGVQQTTQDFISIIKEVQYNCIAICC
jgi:hypothetical protein